MIDVLSGVVTVRLPAVEGGVRCRERRRPESGEATWPTSCS
jgi:hypothetical protein